MMDMAALAVRADATRILTFMIAREGDNDPYPQIGVPEGHHDLSHHGKSVEKQEKIQKINTFHIQHLAYLLDNLAEVDEAGQSRGGTEHPLVTICSRPRAQWAARAHAHMLF